uniref:Uncharacterized protein n=1 Tax=Plectus sambesii TaxID=2011161 RepID=A0A914W849_9BILA
MVMLHQTPPAHWPNHYKIARMASVEELDSCLGQLSHHQPHFYLHQQQQQQQSSMSTPFMTPPNTPLSDLSKSTFSYHSTPIAVLHAMHDISAATGSSQLGGPSVVAIDNKIEQAMDLVKTHLTYAVREEVEVLRSSIVDLEAKVIRLENENALLRQVAPPEIVAQLPYLVAAAQQQQQQNQSATPQQPQNLNPTQSPSQAGTNVSEQ